jgi:hypothetical protein
MERFLAKRLSPAELAQFDARLREAGLDSDVRRPAGSDLLEALRPDPYDELFGEEALLAYVRGDADAHSTAVIDQLRRIDRDMDDTLQAMEAAKRQIGTSAINDRGSVPTHRPRRWFTVFACGVSVAAVAIVAILIFRQRNPVVAPPSLASLLSPSGFGANTFISPLGAQALGGAPVGEDAATKTQLAVLSSSTRDVAKMTPAACLVLPSGATTLTWDGIKATTVRCTLFDKRNKTLAEEDVRAKNSWVYRKPLAAGDYHWTAEWTGKGGAFKNATRRFRVVEPSTIRQLEAQLRSVSDPISRAVLLAKGGYTYDSLRLLDALLAQAPSISGLRRFRDAVAKIARG